MYTCTCIMAAFGGGGGASPLTRCISAVDDYMHTLTLSCMEGCIVTSLVDQPYFFAN